MFNCKIVVAMEIIYKTTKQKSNFTYCSELFKERETLNGFDSMCEPISREDIEIGDVSFKNDINGVLYICYPLSVVIKEEIIFNSLHTLIKEIRRVYREIYKDRKSIIKYGVWGHDIYDLCIESIEVFKDGSVDISIGS